MPTIKFTKEHPDHEERITMPEGSIRITGSITVPEGLETGVTYRLFGLALAEEYDATDKHGDKLLPREWEIWEVGYRNGKLVVESHGFGPKKAKQRGLPEPWKSQLVGPKVEFAAKFGGEFLVIELDGQTLTLDTFIEPEENEDLVLYFGAPKNLEIQPPVGFAITYEIELT